MVRKLFRILGRFAPRGVVPGSPGIPPGKGFYGGFVPTNEDLNFDILDMEQPESRTDIVYDNCNIGIQVSIRSLFVNYPPIQIVYRNPYCREKRYPLPQPPIPENKEEPGEMDEGCGSGAYFVYENYRLSYNDGDLNRRRGVFAGYTRFEIFRELTELNFRRDVNGDLQILGEINGENYYIAATLNIKVAQKINSSIAEDQNYTAENWNLSGGVAGDINILNSIWTREEQKNVSYFFSAGGRFLGGTEGLVSDSLYRPIIVNENIEIFKQNFATANRQSSRKKEQTFITYEKPFTENIISDFSPRQVELIEQGTTFLGTNFFVYSCYELSLDVEKARARELCIKAPPPLPPEDMSCCPNVRQNDELLRLILKRIGTPLQVDIRDKDENIVGYQPITKNQQTLFNAAKINTDRIEVANDLIGISSYPITAPKSIIETYKSQFPESADPDDDSDEEVELGSVTEFLNWQVQQESAVMGGWHQIIQYERDGKTEVVRLVNIAETLKELILIQAGQNKDNSLIVDLMLRALTELVQIKNNVIRTNYIVEDVQDFLDYPTNEKVVNYPLSINLPEPGKSLEHNENIKRFLQQSSAQLRYQDWTGKNSLHDLLLDLLQAAAAVRGVMTESGEELSQYGNYPDGKEPPDDLADWLGDIG